jgi:hypothetical protein
MLEAARMKPVQLAFAFMRDVISSPDEDEDPETNGGENPQGQG